MNHESPENTRSNEGSRELPPHGRRGPARTTNCWNGRNATMSAHCRIVCSRPSRSWINRWPATVSPAWATRCRRRRGRSMEWADDELIVAALVHDVGDELGPYNHAEIAAAILRPYVRPEVTWDRGAARAFPDVLLRPPQRRGPQRPRQIPRPCLVSGLQGFLRELGSVLLRSGLSHGAVGRL